MMHRAATGQAAHTGGARPEPERPDLDHGGVGNRRPVSNSRIRLARLAEAPFSARAANAMWRTLAPPRRGTHLEEDAGIRAGARRCHLLVHLSTSPPSPLVPRRSTTA
jgi:hypothetical protein